MGRSSWREILTEYLARVGRSSDPLYEVRGQRVLRAVNLDIGTRWHHYELNDEARGGIKENATEIPFDDGEAFIIVDVELYGGDTKLGSLQDRNLHALLAARRSMSGVPKYYCRFKNKLLLDRPAGAEFGYVLWLYRFAPEPWFRDSFEQQEAAPKGTTERPIYGPDWDERILELSVHLGHTALWRPELGTGSLERWRILMETITQPLLAEIELGQRKGRPEADRATGGTQG